MERLGLPFGRDLHFLIALAFDGLTVFCFVPRAPLCLASMGSDSLDRRASMETLRPRVLGGSYGCITKCLVPGPGTLCTVCLFALFLGFSGHFILRH